MSEDSEIVQRLKAEVLGDLHLMREEDLRAYWEQVKWPKPDLVELAKSKLNPLGHALNRLAPEILVQASAQLDPFGWLLEAVDVAQWCDFCRDRYEPWMTRLWLAAASQFRAEHRLVHKAHGWANAWEEARRSPAGTGRLRAADNFFFVQLAHANETRGAELLATPGLEERLAKAKQENDEAFLRRFRRAKERVGRRCGVSPAEKYTLQHWLRIPLQLTDDELPGLCFFSDSALHSLLEIFQLRTGGGLATKQIRSRLHLIQAGAKRHLIEDVVATERGLLFTGTMMKKPYRVDGKISWGNRKLWPRRRGQIVSHIGGDS